MPKQLGLIEFGKQLLATKDLDPVYTILWEAQLPKQTLKRWLLAYWCFYHVGTASWIATSESEEWFWRKMMVAAKSKDYPRCTERRHFRGENAVKSVAFLSSHKVSTLFEPFEGLGKPPLSEAMKYIQTWVGFGPWIAFKVCDMLERLELCDIQFDSDDLYLFDSPKEGAIIHFDRQVKPRFPQSDATKQQWTLNNAKTELRGLRAPPRYERIVNAQEIETMLCKWKSYLNGRYHIGEDVESCRKCLLRFANVRLSQDLLKAGKRAKLWAS